MPQMQYCQYSNLSPIDYVCILATDIESTFLVFKETWWCYQLYYLVSDLGSKPQYWSDSIFERNKQTEHLLLYLSVHVNVCACTHAQLFILTNMVLFVPRGNGAINQLIMSAKLSIGHLIICQSTQSHFTWFF